MIEEKPIPHGLPPLESDFFGKFTSFLSENQENLRKYKEAQIREFFNKYGTPDCVLALIMKLNTDVLYEFLSRVPADILSKIFFKKKKTERIEQLLEKKLGLKKTTELKTRADSYQISPEEGSHPHIESPKPVDFGISEQDLEETTFPPLEMIEELPPGAIIDEIPGEEDEAGLFPIIANPEEEREMEEKEREIAAYTELIRLRGYDITSIGFKDRKISWMPEKKLKKMNETIADLKAFAEYLKGKEKKWKT